MTELLLGVDGGGSKTRALVADRDGTVLGVGTGESSNYQSVGFASAIAALRTAIDVALHNAGKAQEASFAAACFGLAGVDRPTDHALLLSSLQEQEIAQQISVVNDAELVLAAGTPDGWGLALICGTGSICYGRAPNGTTARAGGWGYLLGDEGSGYDIAVQALRLATQTADGRAAAHTLLAAILDEWQLSEPSALIGYVYRPEVTRATIASLARRVVLLAEDGDEAARSIVQRAGFELGRLLATVARMLELEQPPLALAGGLVRAGSVLPEAVMAHAGITVGTRQHVADPAQGALVLAQRLLADTANAVPARLVGAARTSHNRTSSPPDHRQVDGV